jgi:transcription-repair coupling factor (superfamily II helicase)
MYQKIDQLDEPEALEAYKEEVTDQYGRLPEEVSALFEKRRLDIAVNDPKVESFKDFRGNHIVTFSEAFSQKLNGVKLFKLFTDISKDIELSYKRNRIIATVPDTARSLQTVIELIDPFSTESPGYSYGWSKYDWGTPAFFRWTISTNQMPLSVERLKAKDTYE